MKQYDIKCPICGTWNKGLFLDETNGWMECQHCHVETQSMEYLNDHVVIVPLLTMSELKTLAPLKVKLVVEA